MEQLQKNKLQPHNNQTHSESNEEKLTRLAAGAAKFQKALLLIELLTTTLELDRGCGWAELSRAMARYKEDFDELGTITGFTQDEEE